jgi:hypothetical protein
MLLQMSVVALGTSKQPLPGFTGHSLTCAPLDTDMNLELAVETHLQMSVVALGTSKQPLPGFTGRTAPPKEHGEMGYNYELAAAMPPVSKPY